MKYLRIEIYWVSLHPLLKNSFLASPQNKFFYVIFNVDKKEKISCPRFVEKAKESFYLCHPFRENPEAAI